MIMNLKKETLEHIDKKIVEYIEVEFSNHVDEPKRWEGFLHDTIDDLDFKYDNGYGLQFITGYIWYADGSWSERVEYDGAEWWEHKKRKPMPRR
jgi:hypothetical protein